MTATATTPILRLTATEADGITRADRRIGDDLSGILACAHRHLDPLEAEQRAQGRHRDLPGSLRVDWHTSETTPHYLGTVRGAGAPQRIYGCEIARRASLELRRRVVRELADAVGRADSILGDTHPLAQYLQTLRQIVPGFHSQEQIEAAQSAAQRGCSLVEA